MLPDEHLTQIRYDDIIQSAMYDGAHTGITRQKIWDIIKVVIEPCIDEAAADMAAQIAEAEERFDELHIN